MRLTVEIDRARQLVLVSCDLAGLERLLEQLTLLKRTKDHVHLMSDAWGGCDLTETKVSGESELVHHLEFMFMSSAEDLSRE